MHPPPPPPDQRYISIPSSSSSPNITGKRLSPKFVRPPPGKNTNSPIRNTDLSNRSDASGLDSFNAGKVPKRACQNEPNTPQPPPAKYFNAANTSRSSGLDTYSLAGKTPIRPMIHQSSPVINTDLSNRSEVSGVDSLNIGTAPVKVPPPGETMPLEKVPNIKIPAGKRIYIANSSQLSGADSYNGGNEPMPILCQPSPFGSAVNAQNMDTSNTQGGAYIYVDNFNALPTPVGSNLARNREVSPRGSKGVMNQFNFKAKLDTEEPPSMINTTKTHIPMNASLMQTLLHAPDIPVAPPGAGPDSAMTESCTGNVTTDNTDLPIFRG